MTVQLTASASDVAAQSPARESVAGDRAGFDLLFAAVIGTLLLAAVSLFVGVSDLSVTALSSPDGQVSDDAWQTLTLSRLPRTVALILAGSSIAVVGMIMQMLSRNKFVEPSTAGTVESASLGILMATMFFPGIPVFAKMLVGAVAALIGTAIFLQILRRIPVHHSVIVPLIGLMLGGVIGSVGTFFAYRSDLLQAMNAWTIGDFSVVLQGRYEMLYLVGALTVVAFIAADRFTVAGLGETFTTNLGLNYRRVLALGLSIVSVVTAVVVVTVGAIPFLGLIVPNLVSIVVGDNVRRAVPWVAVGGAAFVIVCDIVARVLRHPYELPLGVVVGVVGSAMFIYLLLNRTRNDTV